MFSLLLRALILLLLINFLLSQVQQRQPPNTPLCFPYQQSCNDSLPCCDFVNSGQINCIKSNSGQRTCEVSQARLSPPKSEIKPQVEPEVKPQDSE
jgi:hypothetical protein